MKKLLLVLFAFTLVLGCQKEDTILQENENIVELTTPYHVDGQRVSFETLWVKYYTTGGQFRTVTAKYEYWNGSQWVIFGSPGNGGYITSTGVSAACVWPAMCNRRGFRITPSYLEGTCIITEMKVTGKVNYVCQNPGSTYDEDDYFLVPGNMHNYSVDKNAACVEEDVLWEGFCSESANQSCTP